MARRGGNVLRPGDINIPGVARDPGVKMRPNFVRLANRKDSRGAALEDLARAKGGKADSMRGLADRTRQSGTIVANAMGEVAQAQNLTADATLRAGNVVANAQQMFANSVSQIGNVFETLAKQRKAKEDETAVDRWDLNRTKRDIEFQQAEMENPNPKKLEGRALLDDTDARYNKHLDDVTAETEEQLGFSLSGDAKDKITALGYRARAQNMERVANAAHEQHVTTMFSEAQNDIIASEQQVGMDGDIGAGVARAEKIAERVNGVVSPTNYLAFKAAAKQGAYKQGIRYLLEKGDTESAKAIYGQLTGIAGEKASANVRLLIDAANQYAIPPEYMVAASHWETRGTFSSKIKPIGKDGKALSSAAGLGQLTGEMAKTYLGVGDASVAPASLQAQGWAKYTADHYRGLKAAFGRNPSYGELMLAQFVGFGRATRLLQAAYSGEGDQPISKFLPPEVIRNIGFKGSTVGEAVEYTDGIMQQSLEKVYAGGFMQGKEVAWNASSLPIDTAHELGGMISAYERAEAKDPDIRAAKDELVRTGVDLMYQDKLTKQWVEMNRNMLSPSDYKLFMKATMDPGSTRKTEPAEYLKLYDMADNDPAAAMDSLRDMYARDEIAKDDFKSLYARAQQNSNSARGRPYSTEIRDYVRKQLAPDEKAPKSHQARQLDALFAYDDWLENNPKATREEIRKHAEVIVGDYRKIRYTTGVTELPPPRYVSVPRDRIDETAIATAKAKLIEEVKKGVANGGLTEKDAAEQAAILRRWEDLLKYRDKP
jgi:hypothetical protein